MKKYMLALCVLSMGSDYAMDKGRGHEGDALRRVPTPILPQIREDDGCSCGQCLVAFFITATALGITALSGKHERN